MSFFNRRHALALIAAASLSLAALETRAADPVKEIRIDWATYNPVSLILKDKGLLEEEFKADGITIRWVQSAGSNKALEFLNAGSLDFGSTAGAAALIGKVNGNPIKSVYVFSRPEWTALVTKSDDIKSVADLKGKRLSVGAAKSGTELNARAVLKAAGLEYKDLAKVEYLPFGESVELMKNRQLDATLQSAGLGVASIRDLATAIKIVVVPVPADVVAKVGDPAYQPTVIPANTYVGQTTDVPAVAIPNFLVSHTGVSNDLAYQMTKALYTNIDTLYASHNSIKVMKRENAIKGMPIPLHPGAERYYREVGLIK